MARGDLRGSLAFHPFGPLVLAWATAAAGSPLLRGVARQRARAFVDGLNGGFEDGYHVLIAAFIAFGVLRLGAVALGLWTAP